MITPTQIVFVDSAEIHMVGDIACVRWNSVTRKTVTVSEGRRVIEETSERSGEPYIDFVIVRSDGEENYLDDDNPVAGGLGLQDALELQTELDKAIKYLKQVTKG